MNHHQRCNLMDRDIPDDFQEVPSRQVEPFDGPRRVTQALSNVSVFAKAPADRSVTVCVWYILRQILSQFKYSTSNDYLFSLYHVIKSSRSLSSRSMSHPSLLNAGVRDSPSACKTAFQAHMRGNQVGRQDSAN